MAKSTDTVTGKEALSYCTSCKMDLNHVIVAMKGDQIAKVQCLTCKKEHVYRAPKGATEPTKKKTSRKKDSGESKADTSVENEWAKLMNTHKENPFKSYAPKTSFTLGDKLKHATFGEGIVTRLIYPNKIEAIFQNDIKILIHAGTK